MKFKFLFMIISTSLIMPAIFKPYILNSRNRQNKFRKVTDNGNYVPIRIYPDFSYIKYQSKENSNLFKLEKQIEDSFINSIKLVKKLVNVRPLTYPVNKIDLKDLAQWGFKSKNINKSLLIEGSGVEADLVILLKFIETNDEKLLKDNEISSISNKFILDEITKRPIIGVIYLNSNNININKSNIDLYLKSIFLHELTHILGFHYDLFQYFPGGLSKTIQTKKEKRTNKEKKFIITPKVIDFAKKYYNCQEIDGVELEDQHALPWSHWETRILLGEYMTSSPYTPEQIISEFTLSLLEDSGWYKVNYFTGGLMRFGKNEGCEFLNTDCANITTLKSNFKNEFCDFDEGNQPMCSSGRQSRTYCKSYIGLNDKSYKRFGAWFGKIEADNCPVSDVEVEEEKQIYYVGNCKYGNGKYGTHNNFGDENLSNEKYAEILGEKYGPNSFCALSNILPVGEKEKHTSFIDSPRALCYPMFCSSKSLTVQIFDEFIVCPREGGKVELTGKYLGYIYCPDYNLICTGTTFCNDMFDCIEKESLSKEDTFKYDYKVNNDEEKIYKKEDIAELGDDGLCPKNCAKCLDDKKCIKCLDGYSFIAENKFNFSVKCIKDDEIGDSKYCYKDNGIYYNCDWEIAKLNIEIKENEDLLGKLNDLIQNYIEKTNYTEKLLINYIATNLSIIIYKGKGNNELLQNISTSESLELSRIFSEYYSNDTNKTIKCIINKNGNYSISIYDEEGKKINIEKEIPDHSNIMINIKNNYQDSLTKILGKQIKDIILDNKKIDVFNSGDKIFNDICSNFTISGIDMPVDNRKDIFYLGEKKDEIMCGIQNCNISNDKYGQNTLIGECKCRVNLYDNYININMNNKTDIKKEKKISEIPNSEAWKNSLQIFKCINNFKVNEGFYISIGSLGIQIISFMFYIIFQPKLAMVAPLANPGKKTNIKKIVRTDDSSSEINKKDENDKDDIKSKDILNNKNEINGEKVINCGNIDEDIEQKNSNLDKINYNLEEENTIKDEGKNNFKLIKKLNLKNINQEVKSTDENEEPNSKNKNHLNRNYLNTNTTNTFIFTNASEGENNNNNFNKKKETNDNNDAFSFHDSINKKLNYKEKEKEEKKSYDDKLRNKKILILFRNKSKNKKLNQSEKMDKDKNIILPFDYLPIDKAIKYDKRSFLILYWNIFSLKHPIINMFSFFKYFQITESCIPLQIKLIRFLLMLILNIFINSMTITQNYFKNKYIYFNKKYQIEESDDVKIKIAAPERLSYAMTHCFPEVIITFIICIIVQFIINFIFFGVRRELCIISINEKKQNINSQVQNLIKKAKVRYIIFSFINLILMIIFFIYLTNFTSAYSGGALDYIGAGIWTFIFLQIFPFISSLLISLLRYYGMKKNNQKMYKMSQVLLA